MQQTYLSTSTSGGCKRASGSTDISPMRWTMAASMILFSVVMAVNCISCTPHRSEAHNLVNKMIAAADSRLQFVTYTDSGIIWEFVPPIFGRFDVGVCKGGGGGGC